MASFTQELITLLPGGLCIHSVENVEKEGKYGYVNLLTSMPQSEHKVETDHSASSEYITVHGGDSEERTTLTCKTTVGETGTSLCG